jgi:AraC-like DNA-binding protein
LPNQLNDNFVKMAVDVIKENINNIDFDKDSFAKEMNVSPSLLYKKLKSLTGQSPTDFIKDIRMKHAMDLLKSNRYSITEVSEMCGYSSISYFSTVFKKNYGKSPTEVLPTE